jgi:hypothetical protein
MNKFRKMVLGLGVLAAVCLANAVPAHAQRLQVYALQCIGFPGEGYTVSWVTGYLTMASSNAVFPFNAHCASNINGGFAVITGPEIPAWVGPVTGMVFNITTTRNGTIYRDKIHSVSTTTGFFSGTFMADPATTTGEVHMLISVP